MSSNRAGEAIKGLSIVGEDNLQCRVMCQPPQSVRKAAGILATRIPGVKNTVITEESNGIVTVNFVNPFFGRRTLEPAIATILTNPASPVTHPYDTFQANRFEELEEKDEYGVVRQVVIGCTHPLSDEHIHTVGERLSEEGRRSFLGAAAMAGCSGYNILLNPNLISIYRPADARIYTATMVPLAYEAIREVVTN